jgi:hypothetical protein
MADEYTVESALAELRELFQRHVEIKVIACVAPGCVAYRYEVGIQHLDFRAHGPALSDCLAQVKKWREGISTGEGK